MRNVISGNRGNGIDFGNNGGFGNGGNRVQNNFIGTDATGTVALGNGSGIVIGASNNIIGGTGPRDGNLISGNLFDGVQITDSGQGTGSGNILQGNFIGTQVNGVSPLGNHRNCVAFLLAGQGINTVGGTVPGAGNIIAFSVGDAPNSNGDPSGGYGVALDRSSRVTIEGNSIFSNHLRGIQLASSDAPANDLGDADVGTNNLQNFPERMLATFGGLTLTVQYAVTSSPNNSAYPLRVEFFRADADGQEGRTFLGFDTYDLNEAELTQTILLLPATGFSNGTKLVATATDAAGNTSEFSPNVVVTVVNQAPVLDAIPDQPVEQGRSLQLHVTASDLDTLSAAVFFSNGSRFFGSGVLISPTTVLTAAHVKAEIIDSQTTVTFRDTAVTRTVASSFRNPNFNPTQSLDNDLAIAFLDSPVDIAPLALYRQDLELGLQTFLAGYGPGVLHFGINRVSDVDSSLLVFNTSNPVTFRVVNGDSGGPAQINGQVAGVASFTGEDQFAYTRIGQFQSFIDAFTDNDPPATPLTLTFELVDGPTGATFDPSTTTFSWTPAADLMPGTYFATIRVTDNGVTPLSDELTIAIEVLPRPPVVDAGPAANIPVGGTFVSTGSFAFFGDQPLSALVDYGDGSEPQSLPLDLATQSFELNHVYELGGSYLVTVTITGDGDLSVSDSTSVSVVDENSVQRADAGGPYTTAAGTTITLDASASFDPENDIVLYEWNLLLDGEEEIFLGDGVLFDLELGIDDSAGDYVILLRITDNDGNTSTDTTTLTVTIDVPDVNEAPSAAISAEPNRLQPGATVQFSAAGSFDPDAPQDAIASYHWDFGDGSPLLITDSPEVSHVYQTGGDLHRDADGY